MMGPFQLLQLAQVIYSTTINSKSHSCLYSTLTRPRPGEGAIHGKDIGEYPRDEDEWIIS